MRILRIATILAPSIALAIPFFSIGCSADTSESATDVGLGLPDLVITADTSSEPDVSNEDASAIPDVPTEPDDVPIATDTPKTDT
ncbi:MAG: hypothetical protein ACI9OJ_003379, partial [Myxococcota bacterium]